MKTVCLTHLKEKTRDQIDFLLPQLTMQKQQLKKRKELIKAQPWGSVLYFQATAV